MNNHRYILEPYKTPASRYDCPVCGKRKTFSRYIDTETGEHINESVGRCDRESKCGYHYKPKQYFQDNNISTHTQQPKQYAKTKQTRTLKPKPASFIHFEIFEKSLQHHSENNFVKFLYSHFNKFHGEGATITNGLIEKYFIGTSKYWEGATVFWQIDIQGKIRTGKTMLYNVVTGKRVKEPFNHINWVHSVLKLPEYNLQQGLFGEHLLQDKTKPVAIVESEKTAIIASVYLPQFIWCAAGSKEGLNAEKCMVLSQRNVNLFPDLNGFEKWNNKANELSRLFPGTRFNVSDLLERKATDTERQQGLDLADYLIRVDLREFQQQEQPEHQDKAFEQPQPMEIAPVQKLESVEKINYFNQYEIAKNESWEQEITELEIFFDKIILLTQPVLLKQAEKINDVPFFIESHFATVKAHNGNRTFLPYLNRLKELKKILNK